MMFLYKSDPTISARPAVFFVCVDHQSVVPDREQKEGCVVGVWIWRNLRMGLGEVQ